MKKQPNRNHHHLIPRSRGGQNLDSNLLLIKIVRHNNWHVLWRNLTLYEIIQLLRKIQKASRFKKSPQWNNIWGDKTLPQALAILERVYRIKKQQEFYLLLN